MDIVARSRRRSALSAAADRIVVLASAVVVAAVSIAAPVWELPPAAAEGAVASAAQHRFEPSPAPAGTGQLVTVNTGSGTATSGSLSAWDRSATGTWTRVFGPVTAWVGRAGIGAASEGSGRTPAGSYPLTESFGRLANPGTAMPYFQTDSLDWWDSNPASPTYNTHVRRATSPGAGSENLYGIGAVYDYAVNIGYNLARVPGAGSAFFLHITEGAPTAGCVSISRNTMAGILRWLNPSRNPYIDIRVGAAWSPTMPPVGALDPGQPGGLTSGAPSYGYQGWAFDPDDPTRQIDVHLYDTRPDGVLQTVVVRASRSRPDVGAVYPAAGPAHGFAGTLALTGSGRHTICAYAIDTGGGTNPLLGCRTVDIPGPVGALDVAARVSAGQLRVAGWAADPLTPGASETVHIYLSGPTGTVGYPLVTGQSRPDVRSVFPWAGGNTGFAGVLPVAGPGSYRVCAYAINVRPPQTNPLIGCRTVAV